MTRLFQIGLFVVSLIFFSFATWNYWISADSPGVFIEEPERDFFGVKVEQSIELSFYMHNPTRHSVHVLNVASVC